MHSGTSFLFKLFEVAVQDSGKGDSVADQEANMWGRTGEIPTTTDHRDFLQISGIKVIICCTVWGESLFEYSSCPDSCVSCCWLQLMCLIPNCHKKWEELVFLYSCLCTADDYVCLDAIKTYQKCKFCVVLFTSTKAHLQTRAYFSKSTTLSYWQHGDCMQYFTQHTFTRVVLFCLLGSSAKIIVEDLTLGGEKTTIV